MAARDWTMEVARQAGLRMTTAFALPTSLQGATEREQIQKIHALMLDVEELIAASCHTMDRRYPGQQAYSLARIIHAQ